MKSCSKCKQLKAFTEFSKRSNRKIGYRSDCKLCHGFVSAARRASHREEYLAMRKATHRRHAEHESAYAKTYRELNLEAIHAKEKAWRQQNPEKKNALNRKRLAAKRRQTPVWADLGVIKEFYLNCPIGYHVDHIIPLQGKTISGLHVRANLQYLPARENLSKGNRVKEG